MGVWYIAGRKCNYALLNFLATIIVLNKGKISNLKIFASFFLYTSARGLILQKMETGSETGRISCFWKYGRLEEAKKKDMTYALSEFYGPPIICWG